MKIYQFSGISKLLAWVAAITILVSSESNGAFASRVVSETKDVISENKHLGRIRVHYLNETVDASDSPSSRPCSDILMIGVGAAMKVENYDNLATSIVTKAGSSSLVFIISDANPGGIIKLDADKYAALANGLRGQLSSGIIPVCTNAKDPKFLIGGHSASGQATLGAVQKGLLDFVPDGFVGLDPFEISTRTMNFDSPLPFPTMNWGFEKTTCGVQLDKATRGAYKLSSPDPGRVLYLIDNEDNDMTHCVFTDKGCFFICPTSQKFDWVYESVAESVNSFLNAIHSEGSPFSRGSFALPSTVSGNVNLYVNIDIVNEERVGGAVTERPNSAWILQMTVIGAIWIFTLKRVRRFGKSLRA